MPKDDHDHPMTEEEWEKAFKQADAKAARFGELLETFTDDEDRDEVIGRAMGWGSVQHDEADDDFDDADGDLDFHGDDGDLDEDAALDAIRAYRLARDVGLEVLEALGPYANRHDPDSSDEAAERLQSVVSNSLVPGAKIAGGHAMGYDDDALCGNIVCNKRALDAAIQAIDDLRWLRDSGNHVPVAVADTCLAGLDEVRRAIEERIADLRSQVWW